MHRWFCESLYPSYEHWWSLIQQPGVRCVDETRYRIDGVNYWMWVATSSQVCVLAAQALANRFHRHESDWFTFLRVPEVKPDNNDAERALRPVVIHRKTSGGARSAWGG